MIILEPSEFVEESLSCLKASYGGKATQGRRNMSIDGRPHCNEIDKGILRNSSREIQRSELGIENYLQIPSRRLMFFDVLR